MEACSSMFDLIKNRKSSKRRLNSPRYFPRKVFVSEEKVANELENLSLTESNNCNTNQIDICNSCSSTDGTSDNRKLYFLTHKNNERTFQDIEDSLDFEDIEVDVGSNNLLKVMPEVYNDIKLLNRKILLRENPPNQINEDYNKQMVLWKPPDAIENIMKIIHHSANESALPETKEKTIIKTESQSPEYVKRTRTRKYAVTDVSIIFPCDIPDTSIDDNEAFMNLPDIIPKINEKLYSKKDGGDSFEEMEY